MSTHRDSAEPGSVCYFVEIAILDYGTSNRVFTNATGQKPLNDIIRWPSIHCISTQLPVATAQELSDFLQSVEKRAFKRSLYHVRDEDAALDIVQDSMMKLAEHYGDKSVDELPMLFQRILSNTTLDWFRRQKTRNALFSNFSDFESSDEDSEFDLLSVLSEHGDGQITPSAEDHFASTVNVREIEEEIQNLPARQREAFLLRYWEDLDVAETAAAMGCSEGSVKTHCSRAVQALSKALIARGFKP
jgi:RNA polymerase sigma-70 factor (ECF subfamily)